MSYLGQGLGLGREERFTATATAGQTTVTVGDDGRSISYTPNYVDVYLNGVKMVNGSDITVTSGTSIVFASALAAGDSVDVVAPGYFQPADTVSRSLGGTFLGPVNLPSGGLNVGSGQLRVDSSGRVLKPNQPAFSASGGNQGNESKAPGSYFIFGTAYVNRGGQYNTASGLYTAPVAGAYLFTSTVYLNSTGQISFYINGSAWGGSDVDAMVYAIGSVDTGSMQILVQLAAGDFVGVSTRPGFAATTMYMGHSTFNGFLIG